MQKRTGRGRTLEAELNAAAAEKEMPLRGQFDEREPEIRETEPKEPPLSQCKSTMRTRCDVDYPN
jgi:hypothetical protein